MLLVLSLICCRKYLEEPCVWVESNSTTLNILSSQAEIGLGFILIISLISSVLSPFWLLSTSSKSPPPPPTHPPTHTHTLFNGHFSSLISSNLYSTGGNATSYILSCTGRCVSCNRNIIAYSLLISSTFF